MLRAPSPAGSFADLFSFPRSGQLFTLIRSSTHDEQQTRLAADLRHCFCLRQIR